ncbi:MAG: hypothetical protein K9H25_06550 [Rhodospirillum sp.]|nr:hypothetical protein [Rhodospirillum sp.]MCF8489073.1 hypothetical protein [Rhodospirillum sp.]MCF8501224.1 hypothetical protein [Rhodospirillum sp.]
MRKDNVVSIRALQQDLQEEGTSHQVIMERIVTCLEYLSYRASAVGAVETYNLIEVSILAAKQEKERL